MAKHIWPWAWHAFVAGTLTAFAVLEWAAFRHRRHRTLSRALQAWLGVAPRRRWGRLGPLVFASGWIALTVHVLRLKAEPGDG